MSAELALPADACVLPQERQDAARAARGPGRLPTRGILDPAFHYTPSHDTDLRRTFERIRREQAQRGGGATPPSASTPSRQA